MGEPTQNSARNELRSIVRAQILRRAMDAHELCEYLDHAARTNTTGDIDCQALPRVLIDHRQTLQLLAVRTGIEHKVIGPDGIGSARCQGAGPTVGDSSPWSLSRHLQASFLPESKRAVGAHHVSAAREKDL